MAIQAETPALLQALQYLLSRGHKRLQVEVQSNRLALVQALNSTYQFTYEVKVLIVWARDLLSQLSNVLLAHCERETNRAPD